MINELHVKIDTPLNKRKILLRNAIDTTKLLKDYEGSKILFVKKHGLIGDLKNQMNLINSLNNNLVKFLPRIERKVKKEVIQEQPKEEKIVKFKYVSKDKLDLEIELIEAKLENLKIN